MPDQPTDLVERLRAAAALVRPDSLADDLRCLYSADDVARGLARVRAMLKRQAILAGWPADEREALWAILLDAFMEGVKQP